jgi:hypothetical protein
MIERALTEEAVEDVIWEREILGDSLDQGYIRTRSPRVAASMVEHGGRGFQSPGLPSPFGEGDGLKRQTGAQVEDAPRQALSYNLPGDSLDPVEEEDVGQGLVEKTFVLFQIIVQVDSNVRHG